MIDVQNLTKRYGSLTAVDRLTFSVQPGAVTGFLGPNGAGKTTTLRMILGLAAPTSGTATIDGRAHRDLADPGRLVGAVLESTSFHPGRTARHHLQIYCAAAGLPDTRADEVLDLVDLTAAAHRRVGGYSQGMRQRLGLATALLGDPRVLILDEPANGLDPEGIAWLRQFLRHLATADGRTVLISSHVLAEVENTVDHVVIVSAGRLIRHGRLSDIIHRGGTVVRTPTPQALTDAIGRLGNHIRIERGPADILYLYGIEPGPVGHAAWHAHVELRELGVARSDLEQVFLQLTGNQEP